MAIGNKEHKLKTFQDMVKVVNMNNLDDFLIDFKETLVDAIHMKDKDPAFYKQWNLDPEEYYVVDSFSWIDDGKHLDVYKEVKVIR